SCSLNSLTSPSPSHSSSSLKNIDYSDILEMPIGKEGDGRRDQTFELACSCGLNAADALGKYGRTLTAKVRPYPKNKRVVLL
ncbi:hypothetical protein ACFQMG_37785, partial [Kitasatospora paranensis]